MYQAILAFGSDTSSSPEGKRVAMFLASTAKPTLAFWGNDVVSAGTISAGQWVHLAMTFAGGNRTSANSKIYINGVSQTLSGGTASALDLSDMDFIHIGADQTPNQEFNGLIDEVAIWDTALSASDVAKLGSKPVDLTKYSASNLKLWLRAGDKVLPESDASIARSDFYTDFDGGNDSVIVEQTFTTDNFAISFWINPDNVTGDKYLFDQNAGLCRSVIIGYQDGHINFINDDNDAGSYHPTGTASDTQIPVSVGEWQHYVMMTDGTKVYGYRNGVEIINVTGKWGASGAEKFWIGQYEGGNNYEGKMSNVGIYQTVLDAQTISQMAKSRYTPMRDNRFSVVDFDGSDDRVDCGQIDVSGQNITLSAWVYRDGTGDDVIAGRWSTNGAMLYCSGEYVRWYINSGLATTTIPDKTWVHIVGTFDGVNRKIYKDGVLEDTDADTSTIVNPSQNFEIGNAEYHGSVGFIGSISSVSLYNTAKSAEEIYAIYQQGITYDESSLSGLVGYWRMGDDTSKAYPTIADSSSNSNDGTIENGASDDIVQQMVAGYDMGAFENSSEELGSERFGTADNDWTVSSSHVSISNGVLSYTGSGVDNANMTYSGSTYGAFTFATGKLYKLVFTVANTTGGKFKVQTSTSATILVASTVYSSGTYTFYLLATSTHNGQNFQIRGEWTGANFDITNISLKEVLQSDLSDTYPFIADVTEPVLGVELITSNTTSNWTAMGSGTSKANITNGVSLTAGDNDVNHYYTVSSGTTTGKLYKFNVDAYIDDASDTNAKINVYSGASNTSEFLTTSSKNYTIYFVQSGTVYIQFSGFDDDTTVYMQNMSIKEINGNVGTMTNQDSADLVYSSVLPDQSFLTGVNSAYNFLDFDGTDAYVASGTSNIPSGDTSRTISAWLNADVLSGDQAIVYTGTRSTNQSFAIAFLSGNANKISVWGTSNDFTGTTTISTGTWYHVVAVYDSSASNLKTYINGTLDIDTTVSTNFNTTIGNNIIGSGKLSGGAYTNFFNGKIAQPAIWNNRTLSSTEVSAIYTAGRHSNLLDSYLDNLVSYHSFGALDAVTGLADTDSTIYDRSGNSNHGTTSGTATGDLKSPPNAQPEGYSKQDTNRSTTTP